MQRRTLLVSGLTLGLAGCLGRSPGNGPTSTTSNERSDPTADETTHAETETSTPDRSPREQYDHWTGEIESGYETIVTATVDTYPFTRSGIDTRPLHDTFEQAETVLTRLGEDYPAKFDPRDIEAYSSFAAAGKLGASVLQTLDEFAADWAAAEAAMEDRDYETAKDTFDYDSQSISRAIGGDLGTLGELRLKGERAFTHRREPEQPPETNEPFRLRFRTLTYAIDTLDRMAGSYATLIAVSERYTALYERYEITTEIEHPLPMTDELERIHDIYPRHSDRDDSGFNDYRSVAEQIVNFLDAMESAVYLYYAQGKEDGAKHNFREAETAYEEASLDRFFDYGFPEQMFA